MQILQMSFLRTQIIAVISLILVLLLQHHDLVLIDSAAATQDYSIYGKIRQNSVPLDVREIQQINSNCFAGIGMVSCIPQYPSDDAQYQYQMDYYRKLTLYVGALFCLQCCGADPTSIDTWDLQCPFDVVTRYAFNFYGYEYRLAQKKTKLDLSYVICPLRRSFCHYDDEGTLLYCDPTENDPNFLPNQYLVGADLKIWMNQYSSNDEIWNGVTKCEAIAYESATLPADGDIFYQKITMIHPPVPFELDAMKGSILFCLFIFLFHYILKFCRRKTCIICQNPLVYSFEVCMMCKFVGAQPPDPVLLEALEAKGVMIQGVPPERFPGSAACVAFIRFKLHVIRIFFEGLWLATSFFVMRIVNCLLGRQAPVHGEVGVVGEVEMLPSDVEGQKIVGFDQGETKELDVYGNNSPNKKSSKERGGFKLKKEKPRSQKLEKYDLDFVKEAIEHTDRHISEKKKEIYSKREEEKRKKKEDEERIKYNRKHNPEALYREVSERFSSGDARYKTLDEIDDPLQILSLDKGEDVKV